MKFRNLASALALTLVGLFGASVQAATIFTPGDPIVAIWNTTASGNSTASTAGTTAAGQYPAGEAAPLAIDGLSTTKYLNFGGGGGGGVSTASKGLGTGFYITPTVTDSIVQSFQFTAANDAPLRDPLSITIEGSNGGALDQGASWTLIYSGTTGLDTDPGRFLPGALVPVTGNVTMYDSYRVLVTSQRGVANSVQYADVQFFGVPEPTSIVLAGIAGIALLGFARRRTA
ncbi:MAG: PEP-CTERM sorting domain-containing protein [Planctomycetia bacterium]|nr:PEP-CTERM sorting domain-containing protein [Planctomycetia bacterium]